MTNINELTAKAASTIGILENIAGYEPGDIDCDTVELRFEDETGCDTGCDVSIVEQCQNAADVIRALTEALEAAEKRIAALTAERDALREGEMGDAKHSNTRAAADIYFQLVEECDIPAGGSLVQFVDDMKERMAELEARTLTVKLPDVEKWRSVEAVRAQSAYKILAGKAITEAGGKFQIEGE